MTLHVEFVTGPGVGKSTTCSLVYGALKFCGENVELDSEFAKDLTWENRTAALAFQPYIFGKQAFKRQRLDGQVDAILSDTSLLLSMVYKPDPLPTWYPAYEEFILSYYRSLNTLVVFLERDPQRAYNPKGRSQNEEQAKAVDRKVKDTLTTHGIPFVSIPVDSLAASHVHDIVSLVQNRLPYNCPRCVNMPKIDPDSEGVPSPCQRCKGTGRTQLGQTAREEERLRHEAEYGIK